MDTLDLRCSCGAYVSMADERWRVECAREEFEVQHSSREGCAVSKDALPPGFRRETRHGLPIIVGPPARVPAPKGQP